MGVMSKDGSDGTEGSEGKEGGSDRAHVGMPQEKLAPGLQEPVSIIDAGAVKVPAPFTVFAF